MVPTISGASALAETWTSEAGAVAAASLWASKDIRIFRTRGNRSLPRRTPRTINLFLYFTPDPFPGHGHPSPLRAWRPGPNAELRPRKGRNFVGKWPAQAKQIKRNLWECFPLHPCPPPDPIFLLCFAFGCRDVSSILIMLHPCGRQPIEAPSARSFLSFEPRTRHEQTADPFHRANWNKIVARSLHV